MFKAMGRLFATLAVCFGATLAFHACSDSNGFNFGTLIEMTALNSSAEMKSPLSGACESSGNCDGVLPDFFEVTTTETISDFGYTINVNFGETDTYTITSTEGATQESISMQLVNCINSGESGDDTCNQAVGSSRVYAELGSVLVVPFDVGEQIASVTVGGSLSVEDFAYADVTALLEFWNSLFNWYGAQDIVDEGVSEGLIPDGDETRELRVSGRQEIECDNEGGTFLFTETYDLEIDESETVTDVFQGLTTFTFINCLLQGDLLDDGNTDRSVTLNGTVVNSFDYELDEQRQAGVLNLATDDGDGDPFWVNRVVFNGRWNDVDGFNGGICFGGDVVLGSDETTPEDDDCGPGGAFFLRSWYFMGP